MMTLERCCVELVVKKKDVRGYKANEMKCGLLFICLLLPLPSWRFLLIIIYTVLSLISLTYCGEPVVRTLAAPDTSRVTKLFFLFHFARNTFTLNY